MSYCFASSSSLSSSCSEVHPEKNCDTANLTGQAKVNVVFQLTLHDDDSAIQRFITYQLLLKVDGPYNCIVTHSQNEKEEEAQLSITHLPNTSIVEDRLSPIWQPINQDVVIPVKAVRNYYVKSIFKRI